MARSLSGEGACCTTLTRVALLRDLSRIAGEVYGAIAARHIQWGYSAASVGTEARCVGDNCSAKAWTNSGNSALAPSPTRSASST